jgi:hypothetical protein
MQYSLVSPSASSVVVSSKEEEKKKRRESGDSFVNVCLRLQLTCLLLSAICCCRLCLFRVLLDACPFCFLQYTALPTFCSCCLFCVRVARPPLRWRFPQDSRSYKLSPLQGFWAGASAPAFSGWLVYLQFA